MTKQEFTLHAILGICGNHAFGNGNYSFRDLTRWSRNIIEAAEELTTQTEEMIGGFEEPDQPPRLTKVSTKH